MLWDEVCAEVAAEHPQVRYERVLVDALAARMVRSPESLDVVVASNLFADILTDLAAAIQGGMGMAASANLAPGRNGVPGLFEPVHGSAPDIAGQGIGNPCGAIWSTALMLAHLGEQEASARVVGALEAVCRDGPRTRDIGGTATTAEVGDAVAARVAARSVGTGLGEGTSERSRARLLRTPGTRGMRGQACANWVRRAPRPAPRMG